MTSASYYQLKPHVSYTQVDDEAVLLDLNNGAYFGLNHIGTQLMDALEQGQLVDDVIASISKQYQADQDTVSNDVRELIDDLLAHNLISPSPPSA